MPYCRYVTYDSGTATCSLRASCDWQADGGLNLYTGSKLQGDSEKYLSKILKNNIIIFKLNIFYS